MKVTCKHVLQSTNNVYLSSESPCIYSTLKLHLTYLYCQSDSTSAHRTQYDMSIKCTTSKDNRDIRLNGHHKKSLQNYNSNLQLTLISDWEESISYSSMEHFILSTDNWTNNIYPLVFKTFFAEISI